MYPAPSTTLPEPELAFSATLPRPRWPVMPGVIVVCAALLAGVAFSDIPDPIVRAGQWAMALLCTAGVVGGGIAWAYLVSNSLRDEGNAVREAEEAARLGQFDVSAIRIGRIVSNPMLVLGNRAKALAIYIGLLARAGRFEEAVGAADSLLGEAVPMDLAVRVRATKALALLREDRLADADRAIGDLRRMGREGPVGGVLALVEHYRDVRTGHAADLLAEHAVRRDRIATHLGARACDADALAAWASDRLGDAAGAARYWQKATLLASPAEMVERYMELRDIASKYAATPVPPEAQ